MDMTATHTAELELPGIVTDALWSDHDGYDSGLYIPGDVKKLKSIRLGKGSSARQGIIAGINNDFLKLIFVQ